MYTDNYAYPKIRYYWRNNGNLKIDKFPKATGAKDMVIELGTMEGEGFWIKRALFKSWLLLGGIGD